jgi:hypothetical protein
MDALRGRLRKLKEMRRALAEIATGAQDDPAMEPLIRIHAAIVEIEAELAGSASDAAHPLDLTGFELAGSELEPEPAHSVAQRVLEPCPRTNRPVPSFNSWEAYVTYQGRHPWFAAWAAAVKMGGYRTRVATSLRSR